MATGDVKGSIRKLEQRLRMLNYPRDVDYAGLVKGDPSATLPIISYTFTCYSTYITEVLVSLDVELTTKSDLRFIDAVYKVLRDVFNYKPVLTKQQFLQCAFSERKIQIICDIIDAVVKKHKEISSKNKVKSLPLRNIASTNGNLEIFYPEEESIQPSVKTEMLLKKKTLVERHAGSDFHLQSLCCGSLLAEDRVEDAPSSILKEESLFEPMMQIAECQEKLQRLESLEERIQSLERSMKGKIIIDEADWNNILSRVFLLETERLLQSKKSDFSSEFITISEECTSSRMANGVTSDLKSKADIPESRHQSSGYSSLLSADTSPIAFDISYGSLTENPKETTKQRMERITKMMEETTKLLKCTSNSS
ncbi:hypothetical protein GDO86_000444 [Hymenochirus boettgeri]|uniref:Centrosomal protein of 44 kDa n=2 Tax=Hymenochirus boettgeri TaxID=247094 RepID=A0A8T2KHH6_9PIPI|nr:hypothetical protein GDO86_000444 [Hymenochirus boettgeri]